jgi:predicted DNA-binding transcriptional regulator YafY
MKIFEYIDRINLLHKLIKERRTGTPENLAKRLLISPSRLYVILDELKLRGAPINYSREIRSYYYEASFEMSINADFKLLSCDELKSNNGGYALNNIYTTFFVEWANVF